ncbi:MAG: DUF3179 domain-containing (seleno)protein [Candidatus Gracilibacteria bacterium]|nr:DUF3179 domain-containing (seleno)protein [Candidatus Gracilibacteria bacterium]
MYDSNLLMYDESTESLWSQSMGKGVVGEFNGVELDLIKSNLMSFTEFSNLYPKGEVLSDETGFSRNYGNIP